MIPHIRYALESLDDRQVLVVECRASQSAVFLKQGQNEDFYIRVGAGTRKLSMSQTLAYVTERKKER